ncbi:golgin subfamily A member 6-like protein 1 [Planococcus citri]|uniref:golgin subfamily A member 6-like protein 1 n=1 Tax=Planococcus citri TaxID=170843 RepID=UPI0031F79CAA
MDEIQTKFVRVSWIYDLPKETISQLINQNFPEEEVSDDDLLETLRKKLVSLVRLEVNLELALKLQNKYSVEHKPLALEGLDEIKLRRLERGKEEFKKSEEEKKKKEGEERKIIEEQKRIAEQKKIEQEAEKKRKEEEEKLKRENQESEESDDKMGETKIEIAKFSGKSGEFDGFMKKFEIVSKVRKWLDAEMVLRFPLYLEGYAFQYYITECEKETEFEAIKTKMENRFKVSKLIREDQLFSREQGENEEAMKFLTEIASEGKELKMEDSAICRIVLRGLKKEIIEKIGMFDNTSIEKLEENIRRYEYESKIISKKKDDLSEKVKLLEAEIKKMKAAKEDEELIKELGLAVHEKKVCECRCNKNDKGNYSGGRQDNRNYQRNNKYCKICRRNGHHTNDCWYNDKNKTPINEKRNDNRYCDNCKKPGHETDKCWYKPKN